MRLYPLNVTSDPYNPFLGETILCWTILTQVHHSDPFSQNLPKVTFSYTFVKNKHLSLLTNVYITWAIDLAPFQELSVDKTLFCSLHPPCWQDSVGPFNPNSALLIIWAKHIHSKKFPSNSLFLTLNFIVFSNILNVSHLFWRKLKIIQNLRCITWTKLHHILHIYYTS